MFRVQDNILVLLDDVDDVELDSKFFRNPQRVVTLLLLLGFRADGVSVSLDAEAREEINAFDMDTLVHDDLGGQHRVKTA